MAKRDRDMSLYSKSNVMAAYISMIKFAVERIELYIDEIGDEVFFDNDESIFPLDKFDDDALFEGYTTPWSPEDECDEFGAFNSPTAKGPKLCMCDACWTEADAKINRMSVGNIMDVLKKTRKAPQDYRMD